MVLGIQFLAGGFDGFDHDDLGLIKRGVIIAIVLLTIAFLSAPHVNFETRRCGTVTVVKGVK